MHARLKALLLRPAKPTGEVCHPQLALGDVEGTSTPDPENLSLDAEWPDVADYVVRTVTGERY